MVRKEKIVSKENFADVFTKFLLRLRFKCLGKLIFCLRIKESDVKALPL